MLSSCFSNFCKESIAPSSVLRNTFYIVWKIICGSVLLCPTWAPRSQGPYFIFILIFKREEYLFHFPILEQHIFLKKNVLSTGKSIVTTEDYIISRLRTKNKSTTKSHRKLWKKKKSSSKRNFRIYLIELLWEEKNFLIAINRIIKHIAI